MNPVMVLLHSKKHFNIGRMATPQCTKFYVLLTLLLVAKFSYAQNIKHFIYFGANREAMRSDTLFLNSKTIIGAQIRYAWKRLEPIKDRYDFQMVEQDLAFLKSHGKQLFIQLNDATFDSTIISVPNYLTEESQYHGGANVQYSFQSEDETKFLKDGWAARRWDSAVRQRFQRLLLALGEKFDGKIAGINLPETSVEFGSGPLYPVGFTPETYRQGILENMTVLKKAFTKSVCLQYANFMPGGFIPGPHPEYLISVYEHAKKIGMGVGGPDILVYKRGQMNNSYKLIRESSGIIPTGVAVQEGNYSHVNPNTGSRVTVEEIYAFARDYLKLNYIFWCTQAPFYNKDVIPFINSSK